MGGLLAAGLANEVIVLVVLCIAAAALALVGAVRAGQQPARQAEVLVGPLVVAAVAIAVSGALMTGWDPADAEALQRRVVSHASATFALPMVALPTATIAALAVAWLGWGGPRRPVGASWVIAPGLLAAAVIALGGWGQPDFVFSLLRAVALAGFAVVLAVGAVRDDEEGPGLRAVALGVLVLVAAGLEASQGGLVTMLILSQVAKLTPDTWGEGMAAFEAIVVQVRIAGWVAVGGLAAVATVAAVRSPPAVRGVVGAAVVFALLLLGLSRPPESLMLRLGSLCSEVPEGATSR